MNSEKGSGPDEEQEYIQSFCRHVIREKSGNFPCLKRSLDGSIIYPSAAGVTTNRGNKLLQKGDLVTRKVLNSSKPINEDCVYYNGSEHNLLQRRKRMKFPSLSEHIGESIQRASDEDDDEDYDLSKIVDVRKILTPISTLADISKHDAVKRPFESKALRQLSLLSVLMIEKEQMSVTRYSRMLEVFLGDHPEPLYESVLNLPAYDHSLKLPEEDSTEVEGRLELYSQQSVNELNENGNGIEDPFFALPKVGGPDALLHILPDSDSPQMAEEVETTRQLAQIALQRNQEFVRNLRKIRGSLVKANRIKERLLAWSREYAGVAEDGVTVPSALRVVKRGLISATTNMSMGGRALDIEESNEDDNEVK